MIRADAYKLADELADAGYSCSVAIGMHPNHSPREHCSVSVHALRFEAVKPAQLIEIGSTHGVALTLVGDTLSFIEGPRRG